MNPDQYTIQEFMLDVGDGHQIYVHDWGNKDAKTPILVLHGGPGGSSKDKHKAKFDPQTQRVIFHDQRGCGKSLPYGSIEHNTTQDLIGDISKVADRLDLEEFILTGGSWGSALALYYAVANPKIVAGIILDGVLTGSQQELDWFDKGIWRIFYPDVWQQLVETVPEESRKDPVRYHFEQALDKDEEKSKKSIYTYLNAEASLLRLDDRYVPENYDEFDHLPGLIEIHYLSNKCFVEDNYIFKNAASLTMPICMIQGRYDMVCPPQTAYKLHQALPNSQLHWTINGHLGEHEYASVFKLVLAQLLEEN